MGKEMKVEEVRRAVGELWMVDEMGLECVVCCAPLAQMESLVDREV